MMLRLPAVDESARLAASPWGRALTDPARLAQAALAWAKALECAVEVSAINPSDSPASMGATAGLCLPDGRTGAVTIDTALIAGRMAVLTGGQARYIGPVPLSPAEEGFFAWLVLAWCAVLPSVPTLDWVDGGAGLWSAPSGGAMVRWRITIDDQVGWARWTVPSDTPRPAALRADLPLKCLLIAGSTGLRQMPQPGELVILRTPPQLQLAHYRWPLKHVERTWRIAPASESRMAEPLDELPLVVDARVGQLTLTVAEVSALQPGAVLPLAPDATPLVTLVVHDRPVAQGMLVDDQGRMAVQITRIIEGA